MLLVHGVAEQQALSSPGAQPGKCRAARELRALQLEGNDERVVVVTWFLQPREPEPGSEGDADQVGQGKMVHADPGRIPWPNPGPAWCQPAADSRDGADAPRWGAAPRTG
jgi:hypothetical protein